MLKVLRLARLTSEGDKGMFDGRERGLLQPLNGGNVVVREDTLSDEHPVRENVVQLMGLLAPRGCLL